jgi:hypothetical protein
VVAISSGGAVRDGETDSFGLGGKDRKVDEAFQEQVVKCHGFGKGDVEGGGGGYVAAGKGVGGCREFGTSREEVGSKGGEAWVIGREERLKANSFSIG